MSVLPSVGPELRAAPAIRGGPPPGAAIRRGYDLWQVEWVMRVRLTSGGSYATEVLPGLLVIGFGMGCIFAPAFGTATLGVDSQEAGIASAMVNTSQQVGGSVGTPVNRWAQSRRPGVRPRSVQTKSVV